MIASIFVYFALLIALGLYSRRYACGDKALDYFMGGRKLGIVPLAMTIAATYISASSFIGGPGIAYSKGLAWVWLATVQYPVSLLMMGVMGKQLQQLGHQHQLYDLPDYIGLRYRSRWYRKCCAALIAAVLLLGLMVAIMGGSRLLQGALQDWGFSYRGALLIFSLTLAMYTLLGGFRAVVCTDILQGALMLLACFVLVFVLWYKAGGTEGLTRFAVANPSLFRADNGGTLPLSYTVNFTVLVGFGMIVHPITFSRLLALESGKSLRKSILISIAVIGLLTLLPHFIGFLSRIVLPGIQQPDSLMGRISSLFLATEYGIAGRIFSGVLVSAMLAAIMSTADSTLNVLGLTIYRHLFPRRWSSISKSSSQGPPSELNNERAKAEQRHFHFSRLLATLAILLAAWLALEPPRLLVSLNLYALGTTQVTLLWPVLLGIYTRRPDFRAAGCSSLLGFTSYVLLNWAFPNFGGAALLPYSLLLGLAGYFAAAWWLPALPTKLSATNDATSSSSQTF